MRSLPLRAVPRGRCPVCNQGFRPATPAQWAQRWSYHLLMSERHKKYAKLFQKKQGGGSRSVSQ